MRTPNAALFGATLALAAQAATASPATAQSADEAAARAVVEGFKQALRTGDGQAALARLHTDVRIFEGGHAETRAEYESGHLGADMAFLGAVESETTWDELTVRGDLAVYLSEYRTLGTFREREIDSQGTESIVLVRSGGEWLIRHIHWSSR